MTVKLSHLTDLNIINRNETTQPGHILGQPGQAETPYGEREMTPLQVSITRFFLHASLYLGSFSSVSLCYLKFCNIFPLSEDTFFVKHNTNR